MTIDELKAYGANTDEGMQRCLNNEAFYFRMIKMILEDANFRKLYTAVDEKNLDEAFEAAHALKGSTGNLALTPVYAPVAEVTELLRAKEDADYGMYVEKIKKAYDELKRICDK